MHVFNRAVHRDGMKILQHRVSECIKKEEVCSAAVWSTGSPSASTTLKVRLSMF